MRRILFAACALVIAFPAWAQDSRQEPSGCDKFKWPIDHERAILTAEPIKLESGATTDAVPDKAIKIALRPFADAKLPSPPERAPKDPAKSFAGYVQVGAIKTAGVYAVSLSSGAWLDAIQGGKPLKTVAFSGATDCDGIRKVVKFDLRAEPLLLQLSGVPADAIVLAITPAP